MNYRFNGLSEKEAEQYIRDRLELAGTSGRIMDDNAIVAAYGSCGGSVRKLNLILTKALMIGAQNHKENIDTDIILSAVNDVELC